MKKVYLFFIVLLSSMLAFIILGSIKGYADEFENGKDPGYLILDSRDKAGFFSVFFDVIGMLDYYEKGFCTGCEVDFGTTGVYYDPSKGPNWWSYYFSPIRLGEVKDENISKVNEYVPCLFAFKTEFDLKRKRVFDIIHKYIVIDPSIEKAVSSYDKKFERHYVIGVHYRGTDKVREVNLVEYKKVKKTVDRHLKDGCKIFVATDEKPFLKYMKKCYPNKVIYQNKAIRSKDKTAIHINSPSPYRQGREALIDCLLLSKTNLLIRTSSNLSLASTFFNPNLPVIELSKRI